MSTPRSIIFIGNFVQDTVVTHDGQKSYAMGGSVTYGPLAAEALIFNNSSANNNSNNIIRIDVLSCLSSDDLTPENASFLQQRFGSLKPVADKVQQKQDHISLHIKPAHATTAYKLVYDQHHTRTLTLHEQGAPIMFEFVQEYLASQKQQQKFLTKPAALCFVPVAAEFDEQLLIDTVIHCEQEFQIKCHQDFIVATDVQGFIRCFEGKTVKTRSAQEMQLKLKKCGKYITFLKAEYAEAKAILQESGNLTPSDCALKLKQEFGCKVAAVTMGKNGCFLCFDKAQNAGHELVYVPAYMPKQTIDETGCGDCFLATTVAELVAVLFDGSSETQQDGLSTHIHHAVKVGSAATSFRVEVRGPHGFKHRSQVLERIELDQTLAVENEQELQMEFTRYNVKHVSKKQQQQ